MLFKLHHIQSLERKFRYSCQGCDVTFPHQDMTTMSIYARAAKATTAEFKKVDSLKEEQVRKLLSDAL